VSAVGRGFLVFLSIGAGLLSAQFRTAPAGDRPALRRRGPSILPGGRIVAPQGEDAVTGSGAFGLAVSASGSTVVTANSGPGTPSYTILTKNGDGKWDVHQVVARDFDGPEDFRSTRWRGVSPGVALSGEHPIYLSEGDSGRVGVFDSFDDLHHTIDLNQGTYTDSFTGALALDPERNILYVADQANFRIAVIDLKTRQALTSVAVGRLPFAVALSPDRRKLYVANIGMFRYRAIPGADPANPRRTGLAFPAFGFPSAEALAGVSRLIGGKPVAIPALGDPSAPESDSLCVIDVSNPQKAKVQAFIRTGSPFGGDILGGSGPAGVAATAEHVFVSNSNQDSVTVIDAHTNHITAEIPLRIPGLEALRGVLPIGLAFDYKTGRLLVAEAGINAVAVIDPEARRVLGHIPVGWFPTRVAIDGDNIFVSNAKGHGEGPNTADAPSLATPTVRSALYQGTLTLFHRMTDEDLAKATETVMLANGFTPRKTIVATAPLPSAIRYVVLIVKEGRSYDELLGDIERAANGPAMGDPALAHLGSHGYVDGRHRRFSLHDVNVTPNHHAIAHRWAWSDNFYAEGQGSVDGHHWLAGVYPNAWFASSLMEADGSRKEFRLSAAPGRLSFPGVLAPVAPEDMAEPGTLWGHLARHGISFASFGEGFSSSDPHLLTNMPMPEALYRNTSRHYPGFDLTVPDQVRATRFIHEIDERFVGPGADLPQFLFVYLPNDNGGPPRPAAGYPYEESYTVDNDYALGRIVEYLSASKWWNQMAVFVTEATAQYGVDHIDAHRTVLLCAGPWARRNYVSHRNTSFPGLLKTVFELLHVPPLNLFDAAAADLGDCFTAKPDLTRYRVQDVDRRIFDPGSGESK
jgi:YVTN family beta-propeller protein